jgi:hypothetical protein
MKIKKTANGIYVVFKDEATAEKWYWLFGMILRRLWCSYGNFFNAYKLK